jgi:choline dehydrogenase-like flavoprotein
MSGLTFRETMSGPVALGASDPAAGASDPNAKTLAIHCEISIDDVDRFVADREHTGSITGSVEYEAFGGELPVTRGIFNLFSPGGENERLMQYRLAFEHEGKPYFLDGAKHVQDDPGFDVWKDTTTLRTVLHEGSDSSGPAVGAGILSLGAGALAGMMSTMRPVGGGIEPLVNFGKVFLGSLWESYGKDKIGRASGDH